MGSSGGSNYQPQGSSPTPGPLTPFGQATDFQPEFINVLKPNQFTSALPADFAAQQQRVAAAQAAPPPAAAGGGYGGMDAFAQKLLDYKKQQQFGRMMLGFGPQGLAQGIQAMRAPAPTASTPTERLMLAAIMNQGGGGGIRRQGNSVGAYGGGGGSNSPSRGGYSSSR